MSENQSRKVPVVHESPTSPRALKETDCRKWDGRGRSRREEWVHAWTEAFREGTGGRGALEWTAREWLLQAPRPLIEWNTRHTPL